jgi:glutathione S-transferase
MLLISAHRAPNPRRVLMFIAEKGLQGIEVQNIVLNEGQHSAPEHRVRSPFAKVPALQLDDGRWLSETRAICTYLEGVQPEPTLMGQSATERAFIEEADRQAEHYLMAPLAMWIRHGHPGLAVLEGEQFPGFAAAQAGKAREHAAIFDHRLATQPWMAGEHFSIADITAFCALEFARGLMKFKPGEAGLVHLQAWRERVAARPSAAVV